MLRFYGIYWPPESFAIDGFIPSKTRIAILHRLVPAPEYKTYRIRYDNGVVSWTKIYHIPDSGVVYSPNLNDVEHGGPELARRVTRRISAYYTAGSDVATSVRLASVRVAI